MSRCREIALSQPLPDTRLGHVQSSCDFDSHEHAVRRLQPGSGERSVGGRGIPDSMLGHLEPSCDRGRRLLGQPRPDPLFDDCRRGAPGWWEGSVGGGAPRHPLVRYAVSLRDLAGAYATTTQLDPLRDKSRIHSRTLPTGRQLVSTARMEVRLKAPDANQSTSGAANERAISASSCVTSE